MRFTLPIPPTGTNNGYHTNQGRWYKDSKLVNWETECLYLLKGKVHLLEGAVSVKIVFVDKDKRRRDIDGRIKPVLDLLTKAGVYPDDQFVTHLEVWKEYKKDDSKVILEIIPLDKDQAK